MLVVDAAALVSWVMPDEVGSDLDALMAEHGVVAASTLLWIELRNTLIVGERRGRLPAGRADRIADAVDGLGIALVPPGSSAVVMDLARRHELSAHDALHLELALRKGAWLASLDRALIAAATTEGIPTA